MYNEHTHNFYMYNTLNSFHGIHVQYMCVQVLITVHVHEYIHVHVCTLTSRFAHVYIIYYKMYYTYRYKISGITLLHCCNHKNCIHCTCTCMNSQCTCMNSQCTCTCMNVCKCTCTSIIPLITG